MSKIDILVPSYSAPLPQVTHSINQILEFSRCKCNQIEFSRFVEDPEYKPAFHQPARCPNGKHDIVTPPSASMSIIHWARNSMAMQARKDCDYVLFCDADISVEPDALERLLLHEVDIVAGLCTRRTDPAIPNWRGWIEEKQNYGEIVKWDENETLHEVDAVGTGFMLISRACLENVAHTYHAELYSATGNGFWFEFVWSEPIQQEWGEDVSFCLAPGQYVYGNSVRHTEQFFPGHRVWDHSGSMGMVSQRHVRSYSGPMLSIRPAYTLPIRITPNHAVLTQDRGWIEAKQVRIGDWLHVAKFSGEVKQERLSLFDFVAYEKSLKIDDQGRAYFTRTHKSSPRIPAIVELGEDFGRLLGYYLSEGYPVTAGVQFAFHGEETEYIEDIKRIASKLFAYEKCTTRYQPGPKGGCRNILIPSKLLGALLESLCGKGARFKHLPDRWYEMPVAFLKGVLTGYFRGDGCNWPQQGFMLSTVSEQLAHDVRALCLRLGVLMTIRAGLTQEKSSKFTLVTPFPMVPKFEALVGEKCDGFIGKGKQSELRESEDCFHVRVKDIFEEHYCGPVYNIGVEKTNSFNVQGVTVHNCWKAQRLGYKIWVDSTVQPSHWELYPYGVKDYMPFQDERLQAMLAAQQVQEVQRHV